MQNQKITQTKIEQTIQEQAYHAKKGFKINLSAYVIVNSALVTINMLTVPHFPWFFFPMCGWGFGLTMHYFFGVRILSKKVQEQNQMTS